MNITFRLSPVCPMSSHNITELTTKSQSRNRSNCNGFQLRHHSPRDAAKMSLFPSFPHFETVRRGLHNTLPVRNCKHHTANKSQYNRNAILGCCECRAGIRETLFTELQIIPYNFANFVILIKNLIILIKP